MVVFRDLYNAIKDTEQAFYRMDVDIDNAMCGSPKCVLNKAQDKLLDSYMELSNIDVDFCELDFNTAIKKISKCFDCISDELTELLPIPLPVPADSIDACPDATTVIPREHIKRFRVYEHTYTHNSIPSPVQIYMVNALPYSFKPSIPDAYTSYEKYDLSWNRDRDTLKIKLDHSLYPESMGAPKGSYNITMVVAELTDEARYIYGRNEVVSCRCFLMTKDVEWNTAQGLDRSVDGNWKTYPSYSNTPPEVVVEYQFIVE
ncbi:hypothetical protein [Brevibacillus laterosporus]|uniref:hypothetical protein n=1 Tax=Brevibacillus laterosporus TaxID=1465 RepID=UPI003D1ECB07